MDDAPAWRDTGMGAGTADGRAVDGKTDTAAVGRTSAEREDGQYRGHQPGERRDHLSGDKHTAGI